MVIYDYSPTKVELQSHIQFFSGGRPNVTLGGERSILLSYGDILDILPIFHPTVKNYMVFSAEDEKTEFPPLQNRQNRI